MSPFEDTNPRALKELLAEIHNRSTVLPDFQREFVWNLERLWKAIREVTGATVAADFEAEDEDLE